MLATTDYRSNKVDGWARQIVGALSGEVQYNSFGKHPYSRDLCLFDSLIYSKHLEQYLAYSRYSVGEGNGTPLQYSCLESPMDEGAWWAAVHGVAKGRTRLKDFTFTFHFHALEKEMATHSRVLAWRIPGIGEPGGLPSMGLHRVGHE